MVQTRRKTSRSIEDFLDGRTEYLGRRCEAPGCNRPAEHRAPKDRSLTEYHWFCTDHAREYNKAWNYYEGMTMAEIEAETRRDTIWDRPSWPLGGGPSARYRPPNPEDVNDPFGVFDEDEDDESRARKRRAWAANVTESELLAMKVMGLVGPLTMETVKARYKELAKLHHPDRHGGDKAAEEKLKLINEAYATLKKSLTS